MTALAFFLAHPWCWHRRPRSLRVNATRTALECAVLGVILTAVSAWQWWPGGHVALRVVLAGIYAAGAVASVATMRRQP
jgi:hypothetical protein